MKLGHNAAEKYPDSVSCIMQGVHDESAGPIGVEEDDRNFGGGLVAVFDQTALDFEAAVVEHCEIFTEVQSALHLEAERDCVRDLLPRSSTS